MKKSPGSERKVVASPEAPDLLTFFLARGEMPDRLQALIEEYITRKVGRHWDDPVVLGRIQRAITSQKNIYWQESRPGQIRYERGYDVLAYLAYHVPVYHHQFCHLTAMLIRLGLLKRDATVVDAGAGPGVTSLALATVCSCISGYDLTVHALEVAQEHKEAYEFLVPRYIEGVKGITAAPVLPVDIMDIDPADLPSEVDLLVLQNVINEWRNLTAGERADAVLPLTTTLAPRGSVLLVEPADLSNAVALREVSVLLARKGLSILAPCFSPHGISCDPSACWSFQEAPPIQPTRLMTRLLASDQGYRFINTDLKFAWALHHRRESGPQYRRAYPQGTSCGSLKKAVGHRVAVTAAVLSGNLGSGGEFVVRVCDGSSTLPVFAILPHYHRTHANLPLIAAQYGDVVCLDQVLVRFNPRFGSLNLLVNRHSRVTFCERGRLVGASPC